MAVKEQIAILKQNIMDDMAELQQELKVVEQMETDYDAELNAEYVRGFDEGVKQVTTPGDKIYSEEELQAELKPLNEKLAVLESKVAELEQAAQGHATQVAELEGQIAGAKEQGAKEFAAEFVAKAEAAQIDDQALISDLKAKAGV